MIQISILEFSDFLVLYSWSRGIIRQKNNDHWINYTSLETVIQLLFLYYPQGSPRADGSEHQLRTMVLKNGHDTGIHPWVTPTQSETK